MNTQTKQHRNDFREADAIRFGKVAEMRAKVEAGTLDISHRLDVALDRMINVIAPKELTDAELDEEHRKLTETDR